MLAVVTAQELETAELRKKIQELEQGCADVAEDGSGQEKRLVLANQQVAFTVYLDYAMHNMTSNQPIVYNRVPNILTYKRLSYLHKNKKGLDKVIKLAFRMSCTNMAKQQTHSLF